MKNLVIITHRYHYHICQVAILLAMKHYNFDSVTIMYDDVQGTKVGWQNLGSDLLRDLWSIRSWYRGSLRAMPFSELINVHNESSGWIRQQYIKLNLHKLLPEDSWLVVDGDVLLNYPIDPWSYCYINPSDRFCLHHDWLVRYVLNLEDKRTLFNQNPVEFSSVPIRYLTRKTLQGLEDYIYELHNTNIINVYNSFTLKKNKNYYLELSEYDIIGNYQNFISNDLLPLKELEIYFHPKDDILSNWDMLKNKITVLHGWDDFPAEWYSQFGVEINQEIWNNLYDNQKINCNSIE